MLWLSHKSPLHLPQLQQTLKLHLMTPTTSMEFDSERAARLPVGRVANYSIRNVLI